MEHWIGLFFSVVAFPRFPGRILSSKRGSESSKKSIKGMLGEVWTRRMVMEVGIGVKHFINPEHQKHTVFRFLCSQHSDSESR